MNLCLNSYAQMINLSYLLFSCKENIENLVTTSFKYLIAAVVIMLCYVVIINHKSSQVFSLPWSLNVNVLKLVNLSTPENPLKNDSTKPNLSETRDTCV